MSNIRISEGGALEAKDADGIWKPVPKGAVDEILELRRQVVELRCESVTSP